MCQNTWPTFLKDSTFFSYLCSKQPNIIHTCLYKDVKAQREGHVATRLPRLKKSHTHEQNTLKTYPNGGNC